MLIVQEVINLIMENKMKKTLLVIGGLIVLIVLAFALELGGLQWTKFFKPRRQNIERQVFEQTKSFVHGKIQDLAKYYEEYQKADSVEDKQTIAELIKMNFADFDSGKINSTKLRQFLINIRGY